MSARPVVMNRARAEEIAATFMRPELRDTLPRAYAAFLCANAIMEAFAESHAWLPIESAPKDGTNVDVWCASNVPGDDGGFRVPNAWYCATVRRWRSYNDDGMNWAHQPTHWQPLPQPPASAKDSQ